MDVLERSSGVLPGDRPAAVADVYALLRDRPADAEELARNLIAEQCEPCAVEILALGWCRLRQGAPEDAIALADATIVLLDIDPCRRTRARAYQLLAGAHHALGQHDAGIRAGHKAATLHEAPPPSGREHVRTLQRVAKIGAGIAHDLRNMMTAVLGYAELATDQAEPGSPVAGSIAKIRVASRHAQRLIREVLLLSRRTERHLQPIRLQMAIRESLELVADRPNLHIELAIDPAAGPVRADATQIHRVAVNLLENAVAAMGDGGGRIRVELFDTTLDADRAAGLPLIEPGRHVVFRLSDTGHGMDPATVQRMFDPHFTTRPDAQGHGLGMSVVQSIVAGHGGAISVDSEPGRGTTISLYFRRASA